MFCKNGLLTRVQTCLITEEFPELVDASGGKDEIDWEKMLQMQGYISQPNELYFLMFAKCIVQSSFNSPGKLFTAHHTLLNLFAEKLCLSVRRR